ncbi:multiple sugar transport system permease protein [Alkalibacterium putridalgicola]|uniref:Multiple sugar transport system permease protein n=1 Tax=Alkalibacterium putridalgicola TaxID=426703 RepID=A0A1H7QJ55_9LACT|nr:sugar ABC transporter permease [Alkalibacterium putridalgicola]GEK88459.1 sugar ABC transporter permease [Alkalibacterium putridalgicola]SEL47644.1 multiple sugar transport system permease protein [Alkalibacterium putridalgicola]
MKSKKAPYFFIAPALFLLLVFSIIPIFLALFISFTDMSLAGLADYSRVSFIGMENYSTIINDQVFIKSIQNTLFYVVFGVPLVILFSMTIAILIKLGDNKFFSMMRVVFYSPSITNIVAVALVWTFLFNPSQHIGLLNQFLAWFGVGPVGWLTDTDISKISLGILAVWRAIGINMLIFSAALQSIPDSMYEAAELDGANRWQQIWRITIPQLKFSTFFVVVTTIIGWLQFFEEPFVMTDGGPLNSTISVALFIYRNGFQLNNFGYAAAGSLLLFIAIIIATLVQFRIQKIDNK